MKRRAVKNISFTAIVTRNDQGFVARAVEIYLPNGYNGAFSGKTQREAIRKLREAAAQWLEWRADEGVLADVLDEAGFVGAVGSDRAEARIYSSKEISLPLPRNWLQKKKGS
jgi:hypothetical protein